MAKDKKAKQPEPKKGKEKKPAKAPKQRGRFAQFFRDMGSELKKATWPTK